MDALIDCPVDPSMMRLARDYAKRAGLTLLGLVQERTALAVVAVAQFRDGSGSVYGRSIDDLRAALSALPSVKAPRRPKLDTRTLALF